MPSYSAADVDLATPAVGTACKGDGLNTILKGAHSDLDALETSMAAAVLTNVAATVTAPLSLTFTPTQTNHAVTKGYVDSIGLKVSSGIIVGTPASDTVTGILYRTDSSSGSFNLKLPAAPTDGQRWGAMDARSGGFWNVNAVHVLRNSVGTRKIGGVAADYDLVTPGGAIKTFIYNLAADDWQFESPPIADIINSQATDAALAVALARSALATALSAKVKALGFASLTDEAFGGKCDAVELTCNISASGTTVTVPAGHGFPVGAGSAAIGRSFFLPKTGVARDGIAMATYVSATTATLEKPTQFALSAADCGFMQTSWNSSTGNYDISHVKRTGTVSVAAGSTALTDTGGGIVSGGSLAYWLPGAWAETLVGTVVSVPTSTTFTVSVAATVGVTGGKCLVGTDDTAFMTAALTALMGTGAGRGVELRIPRSTIIRPPGSISSSIKITAGPNAKIFGIFQNNSTTEKLFDVTGDDVELLGLKIDGSYSPVLTAANKYVIQATGNDTIIHKNRISNFRTDDTNPSGGITGINSGADQILVCHAIYLGGSGQEVIRNRIDNMSGAGVFTSTATGFRIERNFIGLTLWYSITLDRGADDGWSVSYNRCYTTHTLARHWGGIINLMSQIPGTRNKNGRVIGNTLRGTCDYGTAIRILSLEDTEIAYNTVRDIVNGAYTGGGIQFIGLDTRQATGAGDNGPCKRVSIHDNLLVATGKNQVGIYAKNAEDPSNPRGARAAVEDVWIYNNRIKSPDSSNYFDMGITISGINGGFDRPRVWGNSIEVITRDAAVLSAQSALVGAFTVLGTTTQGAVDDFQEWNNRVVDFGTKNAGANIGSSWQIGFNIIQYVTNLKSKGGSSFKNFHVGVKVGTSSSGTPAVPGISQLEGLTKLNIRLESCDTDMNLTNGPWESSTSATAYTWDNHHVGKPATYTAGSFTQTPPTAAQLGDGGFIGPLYNASVNPITHALAGGNQSHPAGTNAIYMNIAGTVQFWTWNPAT
jgi:hypothetical protein